MTSEEFSKQNSDTALDEAAGECSAPKTLRFVSLPALVMALVLSMLLMAGALYFWYAIGPEVRAQVTLVQLGTLSFFVLLMVGVMMLVGYSHLWASDDEVVIRNGPFIRHYSVGEIVGVRLRKGDPWAYLLVKDPESQTKVRRRATLAIQAIEGVGAGKKVRRLRRWLVAHGASSEGVRPGDVT